MVYFFVLVFLSSLSSLIILTVCDSRNSASIYGLVNLLLLLRISSFPFISFFPFWLFEVELSRNSSLFLEVERSFFGMMAESVSLIFVDDFPNAFLPFDELLRSFSTDFFAEVYFLLMFLLLVLVLLIVLSLRSTLTLSYLAGCALEIGAPCYGSDDGSILICYFSATDPPHPIDGLINLF